MTVTAYRFTGSYTRHEVAGLPSSIASRLTPRQQQVADLIAQGWTNKRIAAALKLEPCTVRLYVTRIAKRLELDGSDDCRVAIARAVIFAWADAA